MNTAIETLIHSLNHLREEYAFKQSEIDRHKRIIAAHDREMGEVSKKMGEVETAIRALGGEVPKEELTAAPAGAWVAGKTITADQYAGGLITSGNIAPTGIDGVNISNGSIPSRNIVDARTAESRRILGGSGRHVVKHADGRLMYRDGLGNLVPID